MLKLPLKPGKLPPEGYRQHVFPWASCAPFVENRRGLLIHRPMTVSTHTILKRIQRPHFSIGYWCGNHANNDAGNITFLAAPPVGSILCERCEQEAVRAGLPSAESLAGRHVHVGRLKAILTCGCAALSGESKS